MDRLERAREVFSKDLYATKLSGVIIEEVKDNYALCSMELTDDHKNAYGGIMGGAIYTLADFAFAVASNFEKDCHSDRAQASGGIALLECQKRSSRGCPRSKCHADPESSSG